MYIADIIREADYWAAKENREYVQQDHVVKAIDEKIYRSNLVEERIAELIDRGVILIDTEGAVKGQVNGLAVYDIGGYMFGKPSRITARTYMGKAGVVDIERQVKMGGNIHSKGVMILSGYLGEKFAQERPLSLSSSICFEQSYSGVEGDSASSAEAYCLLSSLSELPVKQNIAVTGSMNQHGKIQPVGGINEKIEGFFHTCKLKGLNGDQGVMIPEPNVKHLMLRPGVIEAVKKGKFHIWSVSTVEEGIEILTGKKAGKMNKNGNYPRGSVNYLVQQKLRSYSDKLVKLGKKAAASRARKKKAPKGRKSRK
jgi:predicted ATP-dependent protease